jgi:hypothetical protein
MIQYLGGMKREKSNRWTLASLGSFHNRKEQSGARRITRDVGDRDAGRRYRMTRQWGEAY